MYNTTATDEMDMSYSSGMTITARIINGTPYRIDILCREFWAHRHGEGPCMTGNEEFGNHICIVDHLTHSYPTKLGIPYAGGLS